MGSPVSSPQKPSRPNQIQSTRPNTGSPQYRLAPVVLPVSDTLPTRPNTGSPHHSLQGQGVSDSCNSAIQCSVTLRVLASVLINSYLTHLGFKSR